MMSATESAMPALTDHVTTHEEETSRTPAYPEQWRRASEPQGLHGIPSRDAAAPQPGEAAGRARRPGRGADILIVEDDVAIRESLAELLEDEGYRVASAWNGEAALRSLRSSEPPGLILLDLMMPVMNGWEFRQAQQLDPELAVIPVVVVSGDSGVEQKGAALGAVASLGKPIDVDLLLRIVDRYCH